MAYTVLDIGAGSLQFARSLWWRNYSKELLVFSGEPRWHEVALFCYTVARDKATEHIAQSRTGVFRVASSYKRFEFDDDSLDMVTLSAPHPFKLPVGIEAELKRCLKKGGLFFYAYPLKLWKGELEDGFERILHGDWLKARALRFDPNFLPEGAPDRLPASRVMQDSIRTRAIRERNPEHYEDMFTASRPQSSYLYHQVGLSPGYELWAKR